MGRLTSEHTSFLKSHGFVNPRGIALNAAGMTTREFRLALSDQGKLFAYGVAPCKRGHTIRAAGGCPQCNTACLKFARHNISPGYVYIARSVSSRLIKVGSSAQPSNRIYIADLESYGGINDWKVRATAFVHEMGRVEKEVKNSLREYSAPRVWVRNGSERVAREIFKCTLTTALGALGLVAEIDRVR